MPIRVIKHEPVPKCGSYEVRFPDGRPSTFFYWDDVPGRRLTPEQIGSKEALQAAKTFARSAQDKAKVTWSRKRKMRLIHRTLRSESPKSRRP